jgi:hypothetical protein
MGINKVYILSHTHKFRKKSECQLGHESNKLIGAFCSKEKAQDILKSFKKLEGFKDQPEGFDIHEFAINSFKEEALLNLIQKKKSGKYSK